MDPSYLTKQEVAAKLRLTTRTVDKMDADKSTSRTFPEPIRLRGRKRWFRDQIEQWMIAPGKVPPANSQ